MKTAEDEERFEELFVAHYGDVLAYAVRRCPSRQDAEDVVAETFAVAWRRIGEIPEDGHARMWLFGVAHRVRLNQARAMQRRHNLFKRMTWAVRPAAMRGLETQVVEREHLGAALRGLSALDREVLQLHVWEHLGVDQIAATLQISPVAVWKRLQRARDRLAGALSDATADGPEATPPLPEATPTPALTRPIRRAER
ncbi:MAG TPA: sigma-70 family RNA polymerase sigma factor [Egibacteraceae bacterium]|nr:sigma-70 family RNA polymerase sigma factor [Egibacteraceae bacterium]